MAFRIFEDPYTNMYGSDTEAGLDHPDSGSRLERPPLRAISPPNHARSTGAVADVPDLVRAYPPRHMLWPWFAPSETSPAPITLRDTGATFQAFAATNFRTTADLMITMQLRLLRKMGATHPLDADDRVVFPPQKNNKFTRERKLLKLVETLLNCTSLPNVFTDDPAWSEWLAGPVATDPDREAVFWAQGAANARYNELRDLLVVYENELLDALAWNASVTLSTAGRMFDDPDTAISFYHETHQLSGPVPTWADGDRYWDARRTALRAVYRWVKNLGTLKYLDKEEGARLAPILYALPEQYRWLTNRANFDKQGRVTLRSIRPRAFQNARPEGGWAAERMRLPEPVYRAHYAVPEEQQEPDLMDLSL